MDADAIYNEDDAIDSSPQIVLYMQSSSNSLAAYLPSFALRSDCVFRALYRATFALHTTTMTPAIEVEAKEPAEGVPEQAVPGPAVQEEIKDAKPIEEEPSRYTPRQTTFIVSMVAVTCLFRYDKPFQHSLATSPSLRSLSPLSGTGNSFSNMDRKVTARRQQRTYISRPYLL